jgi:hypothetical protein
MTQITEERAAAFVDQYLRVWHEPEPTTRHELVRRLWAHNGVEFTESSAYHGHQELEARVAEAYTEFVQNGGFVFRLEGEPAMHHRAVSLTVGMSPASGGETVWLGSIFALLDDDGLMEREYQFGRFINPV